MVASAPELTRAHPMSSPLAHWKPSAALAGAPARLHPWLADPGSLTARIKARCQNFRVQVIRERHARPHLDEHVLIDVPLCRHAWVREVLLIADDQPVVFAHSVLRLQDLAGAWHMARAIGSRPLGAALFADPGIQRGALYAARISLSHPLHQQASQASGLALPALWGRRSRFTREGRPLLVTEVFLPGIFDLPA